LCQSRSSTGVVRSRGQRWPQGNRRTTWLRTMPRRGLNRPGSSIADAKVNHDRSHLWGCAPAAAHRRPQAASDGLPRGANPALEGFRCRLPKLELLHQCRVSGSSYPRTFQQYIDLGTVLPARPFDDAWSRHHHSERRPLRAPRGQQVSLSTCIFSFFKLTY
jgi:hypothetical protein